jgi:hypothetical protein
MEQSIRSTAWKPAPCGGNSADFKAAHRFLGAFLLFPGARRWYARRVIDCTLVTCDSIPQLDPDDRLLLAELLDRGLSVSTAVWSDPGIDWSDTAVCVLRSTWDYHFRWSEFFEWIERAAALTAIRNDLPIVCWNAHKSYICSLENAGVRVVPTAWVARGGPPRLDDVRRSRGWRDVVLKPARGAAAHDVTLVHEDAGSSSVGQETLEWLARTQDVLVQPYLRSVESYGERALMFLGRRYSHAVVKKKAFDTVLAIDGDRSSLVEATAEEIEVAQAAVAAVPGRPIYARVDLLRDDEHRACVSELELIEPALYLAVYRPARAALADAIEAEISKVKEGAVA